MPMTAAVYILLCLVWGSTWLAIKVGLSQAPPLTTAALRFIIAVFILSSLTMIRGYQYPKSMRELLRLGYPGLYMYGISYATLYFSELYISSALTAVLFASFPFFVALISWFRYRTEPLQPIAWGGMGLGFMGVVLISYDTLNISGDLFLGTVLALAGSLAAAYGMTLHKNHHARENIAVAANVQMIFGGLPLLVGALLFDRWWEFPLNPESIGSVLYLAVFGSVVAFLGYYWLLRRTTAVTVSLIAFVTPVIAIVIGVFLADEQLTTMIYGGTAMILLGVFAVLKRSSPLPKH